MNHGVITSDIIAWAGPEVPNIGTPRVGGQVVKIFHL